MDVLTMSATKNSIDLKSDYIKKDEYGFLLSKEIKLTLNVKYLLNLLTTFFSYRFNYNKEPATYPTIDLADGIYLPDPSSVGRKASQEAESMRQYHLREERGISINPHCSNGEGCLGENLGEGWYKLSQSKYFDTEIVDLKLRLISCDNSKINKINNSHWHGETLIKEMGYQNACFDDLLIFALSGVFNTIEIGRKDPQLSQSGWSEDYRIFGLGECTKLGTDCCGAGSFYPAFVGHTNSTPKRIVTFKQFPFGGMYLGVKLEEN